MDRPSTCYQEDTEGRQSTDETTPSEGGDHRDNETEGGGGGLHDSFSMEMMYDNQLNDHYHQQLDRDGKPAADDSVSVGSSSTVDEILSAASISLPKEKDDSPKAEVPNEISCSIVTMTDDVMADDDVASMLARMSNVVQEPPPTDREDLRAALHLIRMRKTCKEGGSARLMPTRGDHQGDAARKPSDSQRHMLASLLDSLARYPEGIGFTDPIFERNTNVEEDDMTTIAKKASKLLLNNEVAKLRIQRADRSLEAIEEMQHDHSAKEEKIQKEYRRILSHVACLEFLAELARDKKRKLIVRLECMNKRSLELAQEHRTTKRQKEEAMAQLL